MSEHITPINGKDGTAGFTIDPGTLDTGTGVITYGSGTTKDYTAILTQMRIRSNQELIDVTTFNEEGTTKYDEGRLVLEYTVAGLLTKGGAASGPLIPPPQKVQIEATFSTGCSISSVARFTEAEVDRTVNVNGLITGRALADGDITLVWDHGS